MEEVPSRTHGRGLLKGQASGPRLLHELSHFLATFTKQVTTEFCLAVAAAALAAQRKTMMRQRRRKLLAIKRFFGFLLFTMHTRFHLDHFASHP